MTRTAHLACAAMLAAAMLCAAPAAAQQNPVAAGKTMASASATRTGGQRAAPGAGNSFVDQPRAFGYTVGDVLTQRILLPDPGARPVTAPRAQRISGWLERRPLEREIDAQGRHWLLLSHQIVNAPQTLTAIAIPALALPMTSGPALRSPEYLVSVAPLTPKTVLAKGGLLELRPDSAVPLLPTAELARRLYLWLWALAATLLAWALWWAARGWREARRLPFARAWGALRRMAPEQNAAWLLLHRALDQSFGATLRAPQLPVLLARAPHLQPLRAQLERFYACSDQRFFACTGTGADTTAGADTATAPTNPAATGTSPPFPLHALCRALCLAEKRARR